MPLVTTRRVKKDTSFPVEHLSAWSLCQFGTNPFMFKINQIQGEFIETTNSAKSVLGKGFHKAMDAYYFGTEENPISTEGEGLELGLNVGMQYNFNSYDRLNVSSACGVSFQLSKWPDFTSR